MAKHFATSVSRGAFARAWRYLVPLALALHGCTVPTFVDPRPDAELEEDEDADVAVTRERDAATPSHPDGPDNEDVDAGRSLADGGAVATADASAFDSGPASDAGNLQMTMVDADVSTGPPAWAMPLIGTYAKRTVTFSWDDEGASTPYNTQNVELSIMKITQNGSALDLSVQLCDFRVSVNTPDAPLFFVNAPKTLPITGQIKLGAPNTFTSSELLGHLGFDPSPERSACSGGRRDKFPGQTWISGTTCRCLGSQLPISLDDCRVIDNDDDGRAGITSRGPVFVTPIYDYVLVFDYAVTIIDGQVAADGNHTLREKRAQGVSCINATVDGCNVGHNTLCPGAKTKLIKHTGSSPLTCASINMGAFGPLDGFPADVECRAK